MIAFFPKEFQAVGDELDETKRHDFLSDEARSGFGDDDESLVLVLQTRSGSTSRKRAESEHGAAVPVEDPY